MAQERLDHTSTLKDVLGLYGRAGVDIDALCTNSKKPLSEFVNELKRRELRAFLDQRTGDVVTYSHSVKMLVSTPEGLLLETGRRYKDAAPIEKVEGWTVSGREQLYGTNRKQGETPIVAVMRETRQELRLRRVPQAEIKELTVFAEGTLRNSKVWHKTKSIVMVRHFQWNTERVFRRRALQDTNNTVIDLQLFPAIPPEVIEAYEASKRAYDIMYSKLHSI